MRMGKKAPLKVLTRTSVLVPKETKEALEALAEKGNRSLSREIRQALEEYVEKQFGGAA